VTRLCAVSVDLDEIPAYRAIHGLCASALPAANAVYDLGLPRLADWAQAQGLVLTLFAIGADLARTENAAQLRALAGLGHELANHTLDHRYELTRLSRTEMERQVQSGIQVLEGATGQRPTGFRAPGYTVSDELFELLRQSDVAYDSSVFPCPAYYAAKALALASMRLRSLRSQARLASLAVLRAPARPYRVGRPYWQKGEGMLELPIGVTRRLRLPYIGTALTLLGPDRARWLTRGVIGEPVVNLELHGIDALDASDGLGPLRPHQLDLRVPVERKLACLTAALEALRAAGYSFVRLDEAAAQLRRG
jgi:peptidoglycan/xylan/chitin deacetylase (PgdA/CDA1 family)